MTKGEMDTVENSSFLVKGLPNDLNSSATNHGRGSLKIFLGYCAGVGKTYRMLQEANVNKRNGIDVVVGIVETHGRVETEELAQELEIVPRKTIKYSGITVSELDLDAILTRRPQLVLIDELAHTNVILGSRHAKRYQDVEELLNAGINVYSTLNVQHIQSLVDIIYQITRVKVEEIIPDRILELAIEVELVDLSPEKLHQRLANGKVYIPQKAQQAMKEFFKKGNLIALRELSLKYTAKRVDIDLLSYRKQEDILNVWPIESKLLVGISANKASEKLLLTAHRMATDLNAEWYAVHVESPQEEQNTEKLLNQLYRNIHLAEELGAKVVSLSGNNIADEIIKFAKQVNVTLIIAGLSQRSFFTELIKGSVLKRLVKTSGPINLLIVGDSSQNNKNFIQAAKKITSTTTKKISYKPYFLGIVNVLLVLILCWCFKKWISVNNVFMLMLFPAIASGIVWGVSVGLVASFVGLVLTSFLFIAPTLSFMVSDLRYFTSMVVFVLIVFGVSFLGKAMRWHAENARYRERFIYALYNFGRELMEAKSSGDVLSRAVYSIVEAFDSDIVILLPGEEGQLELTAKSREDLILSDSEKAVATWVYKNGRHAGCGTNTLSSAKWYYLPLKVYDNILGTICVMKSDIGKVFSPEQRRLLESFSNIISLELLKTSK